jgi:hypothetical protein
MRFEPVLEGLSSHLGLRAGYLRGFPMICYGQNLVRWAKPVGRTGTLRRVFRERSKVPDNGVRAAVQARHGGDALSVAVSQIPH